LVDYSHYLMSLAVLHAFLKAKVKSFLAIVFLSLFITSFFCNKNLETLTQMLTEGFHKRSDI